VEEMQEGQPEKPAQLSIQVSMSVQKVAYVLTERVFVRKANINTLNKGFSFFCTAELKDIFN
jgi:hypothetical protein